MILRAIRNAAATMLLVAFVGFLARLMAITVEHVGWLAAFLVLAMGGLLLLSVFAD